MGSTRRPGGWEAGERDCDGMVAEEEMDEETEQYLSTVGLQEIVTGTSTHT